MSTAHISVDVDVLREEIRARPRPLERAGDGIKAVSLVDSSGIALMLIAFRRLDYTGRQLAITCPMGSPRRAFELTALDRQLPMYETRRDALAALGAS
jgi:hypothetical protein